MKRLFSHQALVVSAIGTLLFLVGCSTVQTRINERPEAFHRMSPSDQALVSQGQIRAGLSQDAVYIAWGAPNQRALGRSRGDDVETWIYYNTTSGSYYPSPFIYGPYAGFGYGYGYGGGFGYRYPYRRAFHGFYYDPFYDPFFYNRVNVVSYPDRTVSFQGGRVIAYQYLPAPVFY